MLALALGALGLGQADIDRIVQLEAAQRVARPGQRYRPAVGQSDPDVAALFLQHDRLRPMHVIEREPRIGQRLLPGRLPGTRLPLRLDPADRLGQIGFRGLALHPAGRSLVARQPLLQGRLGGALHRRNDGRTDGVGLGGEPFETRDGARLARDLVGEVEPDVAPRPLEGDQRRHADRDQPLRLVDLDNVVLAHALHHVDETVAHPLRVAVGIEEIRSFGQCGQERALGQRELASRFPEIGARRRARCPRSRGRGIPN